MGFNDRLSSICLSVWSKDGPYLFPNEYKCSSKIEKLNRNFSKSSSLEPLSKHRDDVIISGIRIGHSQLTHSYLLKREHQPEYIFCDSPFCDCPLTNLHVSLMCSDIFHFSEIRKQCRDFFYKVWRWIYLTVFERMWFLQ